MQRFQTGKYLNRTNEMRRELEMWEETYVRILNSGPQPLPAAAADKMRGRLTSLGDVIYELRQVENALSQLSRL